MIWNEDSKKFLLPIYMRYVLQGYITAFAWRDLRKTWEPVMTGGYPAQVVTFGRESLKSVTFGYVVNCRPAAQAKVISTYSSTIIFVVYFKSCFVGRKDQSSWIWILSISNPPNSSNNDQFCVLDIVQKYLSLSIYKNLFIFPSTDNSSSKFHHDYFQNIQN